MYNHLRAYVKYTWAEKPDIAWVASTWAVFGDKFEQEIYDMWFGTYLSKPVFDSPCPRRTVDGVFHFDSNGRKARQS